MRSLQLQQRMQKKYLENNKSGDYEIRTHDTVSRIHTFQACSFNHSDKSPVKSLQIYVVISAISNSFQYLFHLHTPASLY